MTCIGLVVMYYLTIFIVKSVVCFTVAQLLQSQGEVKRLLDRVGETTRDRAEMV